MDPIVWKQLNKGLIVFWPFKSELLHTISLNEHYCLQLNGWILTETTCWYEPVHPNNLRDLLDCKLRGFAPRYAKFTLAFLPSMMGFASLHARSAAPLSIMVTCWQNHSIALVNITRIDLLYMAACESLSAQSGLEWSQRECTDEATDSTAALRKLLPLPLLEWFNHFLLNVWGDTDSTSWRQKSSWFKASSVGGRFFFFFFSDWAERMRYRNLPWGSELKSGQIAERVEKVTTHTHGAAAATLSIWGKLQVYLQEMGHWKQNCRTCFHFAASDAWLLCKQRQRMVWDRWGSRSRCGEIKGTVHPKRKVHTNASGKSGESS